MGSKGFPGGASGKEPIANAGDAKDMSSIPGSGRSPGEGNGNPLQYSCLANPMDRGAQSCPTFCNPTDCSLPGSSICGLLQARILEWIAIPFFISLLCHMANSYSLFKLRISTVLLEGLEWRPSLLPPPLCPSPSHTGVQRSGYDSVSPTGLRIP